MQNALTIARREFAGYFNGPVAYIVICLVLIALGVFFWPQFFLNGVASLRDMFHLMGLNSLFAAPAMSMGLIAEERRTGTIETSSRCPFKTGKSSSVNTGVMGLFGVMLLLTMPYAITVYIFGQNMDWAPSLRDISVFFCGGSMIAIGLMASSFTSNQLVAFFIGLAICLFFRVIHLFVPFLPNGADDVFQWISLDYHYRSMMRGIIDTRDVLFFLCDRNRAGQDIWLAREPAVEVIMATDKYTRAASASLVALLLTIGIVVSLNVLGVFIWARVDMTENQRYSLSDSSRELVGNLDSAVDDYRLYHRRHATSGPRFIPSRST